MISAIMGIIGKALNSLIDNKITKDSFLRGVRMSSSIIILLLSLFKQIPIQLKYESHNLRNFIHFFDSFISFNDIFVHLFLYLCMILLVLLDIESYKLATLFAGYEATDKERLNKWCKVLTAYKVISIICTLYYLLVVCYKIAQYLIGTDCNMPILVAGTHLLLCFNYITINEIYNSCKKNNKWKRMSPYCDSNGKTLYSEMKVFYYGKAYYVEDSPKSDYANAKEWFLISIDEKSTLKLDEIDYHQLLVAQD